MGHDQRIRETAEASQPIYEARGRPLQEGDEIILATRGPIYFRVAQITPVLDPSAPPNLVQVHVAAILTFVAKKGSQNNEFIRVRTSAEAGPQQLQMVAAIPQQGGGAES